MATPDLVITSRRTALPEGLSDAAVVVHSGRIAAVVPRAKAPPGRRSVDLDGQVLLPGLVDSHTHLNEPGRDSWEGFKTGTRAALAGGITTIVDMPLNSIPATTTRLALEAKARAAAGRCFTDYAFWGGLVPDNLAELEPMLDTGVCGFKCFLIDSGVPEFPAVGEAELRRAMPLLARRGAPLLVHAELESADQARAQEPRTGHARRYGEYLASRPRSWENEAVRLTIRLCRDTGCQVHIVHLSSSEALADLAEARREGLAITAETCPHYLTFSAEEIPDGATQFKCAPPIREAENRERLWNGLANGTLRMIVSDHSPCEPGLKRLKEGSFAQAWGGIASLQFSLAAAWTGARRRGLGLEWLAAWMAEGPAGLAGLASKGRIAPGMDADLVAFDPEASFEVLPSDVLHRHPLTPYAGRKLFGRVERVWLRGELVCEPGLTSPTSGSRQSRTRMAVA